MSANRNERHSPPELWGGIECTVNRVRDAYHDQLERSGHDRRPDDLDRVAELGLRVLRYPVLWERVAPDPGGACAWGWSDDRLGRLRALGVRPIVGLVHHGSGPRHTALTDPGFSAGLADFAAQVARRYPWVEDFTPVNEPLTTARFSALYGHWYPHAADGPTFARAVLEQCRAVVLAMRAIREVHPGARLVQTDDLGMTHSTPALRYQADFENERRWLTFDLLCGRVDRRHPVGAYLLYLGVPERELDWFRANPCPPDVVGLNHYLTSERFLDENTTLYPPAARGGNGRHEYADVEAVRVGVELMGAGGALREAWRRYRLPLAITEMHLGCTREEQLRWVAEVWDAAAAARADGVDVRAVTLWSLLGAFDWDSLVKRQTGRYESGAFDVRGPRPRPTVLAAAARQMAAGRRPEHPVLDLPGWWRRPERLLYSRAAAVTERPASRPRPLLVTGARGTLARAFGRACEARGLACRLLGRGEMDVANRASVAAALDAVAPWAVINAAGFVRVDEAEGNPDACWRENSLGPAVLADACARLGVPLLTFSSDLVFDGRAERPYRESDAVNPLCLYGLTKAEAERAVRHRFPQALVVRTSAFFGPWDEHNFVTVALRALAAGRPFPAADDVTVSPTYVPDLVHACLDLVIDGAAGVWHLANPGGVTWADLAREAARRAGLDAALVRGRPARDFGWAAPRPAYTALGSERAALLPPWEHALARYFRDRDWPSFEQAGPGRGAVVPRTSVPVGGAAADPAA